jgi:hypothetical protein
MTDGEGRRGAFRLPSFVRSFPIVYPINGPSPLALRWPALRIGRNRRSSECHSSKMVGDQWPGIDAPLSVHGPYRNCKAPKDLIHRDAESSFAVTHSCDSGQISVTERAVLSLLAMRGTGGRARSLGESGPDLFSLSLPNDEENASIHLVPVRSRPTRGGLRSAAGRGRRVAGAMPKACPGINGFRHRGTPSALPRPPARKRDRGIATPGPGTGVRPAMGEGQAGVSEPRRRPPVRCSDC